jgi:hypothetical protein
MSGEPKPKRHTDSDEWAPVPGWEDYFVSRDGRIYSHHTGQELRPYLNSQERGRRYLRVDLRSNGARRQVYVHHLVLEAHVGKRPDGHHAHHIDGDQFNNALANLEWREAEDHMGEHNGHAQNGQAEQAQEDGAFAPEDEAPF